MEIWLEWWILGGGCLIDRVDVELLIICWVDDVFSFSEVFIDFVRNDRLVLGLWVRFDVMIFVRDFGGFYFYFERLRGVIKV